MKIATNSQSDSPDEVIIFFDTLAERIVYLRRRCQLGQRELAIKSGIGRGTIANIESGYRHPTVTTLYRISQALDIPICYFFMDAKI